MKETENEYDHGRAVLDQETITELSSLVSFWAERDAQFYEGLKREEENAIVVLEATVEELTRKKDAIVENMRPTKRLLDLKKSIQSLATMRKFDEASDAHQRYLQVMLIHY